MNLAQGYFDRLAATGIWQDFTAAETERLQSHLQRWDLRPGQTVVEPGCGAGRLTAILADRVGREGRVIACDPAAAMTARATARGLPPQVALHACTVAALELAAASVDRVICFHVWPHIDAPAETLRRLRTAMRPGATLWIAHLKSRDAINRIHADGPPEIRHHCLPPLDVLQDRLRDAGLSVLEAHDGDDGLWIGAQRPA